MIKHLLSNSLKKKLLVYLVFGTLITWGFTAWISYYKTYEEVGQLFDAQLAQSAGVLHAFVESMLHEGSLSEHWDSDYASDLLDSHKLTHKYARKIAFQIISLRDGLILRSKSAPVFPLSESYYGYTQTVINDKAWFVFSVANNNGEYVIHVGQREDIRKQVINEITAQLLVQFLLGLPVLALVIWITISHILSPIEHLKSQLAKREAGRLEPIPLKKIPLEIVPLVTELNSLFSQVAEALENERNFTSDASHELRTPLAGLLLQVHVAKKTNDTEMRKQALDKANQAVLRMSRIVQQLLTLSRLQNRNERIPNEYVDVNKEIIGVITELEHFAHQKNLEIEFNHSENYFINANVQLFCILIRNLIENAIKYAPQDGHVLINTEQKKNQLRICVEDNGPGIKREECKRLTQRFFRSVETAKNVEGSGLGLSIVQRIATIYDANISFVQSKLGGLKVDVLFNV